MSQEHAPEGGLEILECWHLSSDELTSLLKECLLPLAETHGSLGLAQSLQVEGITATKAETKHGEGHKVPTHQAGVLKPAWRTYNITLLLHAVSHEHRQDGCLIRFQCTAVSDWLLSVWQADECPLPCNVEHFTGI